jgi:hypothetical protein
MPVLDVGSASQFVEAVTAADRSPLHPCPWHSTGGKRRMSILWIIIIVILVLAVLGFFGRGRF